MKKGTSIFLSICAGVAIVFGICGCLYGFNSKVHDWVNAQVGKTQDTTDSITLSLEPSWAELKRTVVADSPTASFVITAKKGDKEVADAHLVYDVDNSKAGASNIVISADKAHTAVDDDPASQFAGTYYLSGVTMTITTAQEDLTKWTGYSTINFYLETNEAVSASFKVTYTLEKVVVTSSGDTSTPTSSTPASSTSAAA
jgi:hypothetical protein